MMSSVVLCIATVIYICSTTRFASTKRYDSFNEDNLLKSNLRQKSSTRNTKNGKIKIMKPDNSSINSIKVDGITHFEVLKSNKSWKKINKIEKDFKNLIAMRGVTFVYKRDTFWRTWRDVDYKMSHKTIFYKCSNIINTSCTGCYGGGFWVFEEDQVPCPYEIFSMINKNKVCAVNYTHLENIDELCPSVLSLFDLTISCNNPIVTMYRITRSYSNSTSERNHSDICGGREFCEISTIYRIYQDFITFQIINLNKDVIYSKIMMNNNKTFAYFNTTRYLLDPVTPKNMKTNKIQTFNVKRSKIHFARRQNERGKISKPRVSDNNTSTTLSPCKKLQTSTADYYDEEDYDYEV